MKVQFKKKGGIKLKIQLEIKISILERQMPKNK